MGRILQKHMVQKGCMIEIPMFIGSEDGHARSYEWIIAKSCGG